MREVVRPHYSEAALTGLKVLKGQRAAAAMPGAWRRTPAAGATRSRAGCTTKARPVGPPRPPGGRRWSAETYLTTGEWAMYPSLSGTAARIPRLARPITPVAPRQPARTPPPAPTASPAPRPRRWRTPPSAGHTPSQPAPAQVRLAAAAHAGQRQQARPAQPCLISSTCFSLPMKEVVCWGRLLGRSGLSSERSGAKSAGRAGCSN